MKTNQLNNKNGEGGGEEWGRESRTKHEGCVVGKKKSCRDPLGSILNYLVQGLISWLAIEVC